MVTITWLSVLIVLSVSQVNLYRFTARDVAKISLPYGLSLYAALILADTARWWFQDIGLRWWLGIMLGFAGYLAGEWITFFFRNWSLKNPFDQKTLWEWKQVNPRKKKRHYPSFLSFSLMFAMLSWLPLGPRLSFGYAQMFLLVFCFAQIVTLGMLAGIRERLVLANVPKSMDELPILLVSGALLLMVLGGIARNLF